MEVRRIGPDGGFERDYASVKQAVKELGTRPTGNVVVRETMKAVDPLTGVETILGELPDGSFGFQPFVGDIEPPPVATVPLVSAEPGTFVINWDGRFVLNQAKPRDFEQVNIIGYEIPPGSNPIIPSTGTRVGIIRKAGEPAYVSTDVARAGSIWQFRLESEDYNGNRSAEGQPSASLTMVDVISSVDIAWQDMIEDVGLAKDASISAQSSAASAQTAADRASADALEAAGIAAGKGKVLFQTTAPGAADRANTLWIDITDGVNTPKRWNGTIWADVSDKKVVDAANSAAAAEVAASQAFSRAEQAATSAGEALTAANGKNRNWYRDAAPAGVDHRDGDIWFDTDDGNKMYIWKTSTNRWESIRDAEISSASAAASAALLSANGKNRVIWSTSDASGTNYTAGDVWFKRDAITGSVVGQWEFTTSWQVRQLSNEVIANIDAGKISVGFLDSARIRSGSIAVDKLLVGIGTNLAYNGSAEYENTQGYNFTRVVGDAPEGYSASWSYTSTAPTTSSFLTNPGIPVKPNTQYRINVWVKSSVAGTRTYLEPATGSSAHRTTPVYAFSNVDVPTVWTKWTSVVTTSTAPNGTLNFKWYINHQNGSVQSSTFSFTGFELMEMNSGELVVDGSIRTNHIGAGQIDAGKIAAGSISAPHIASKSITTDKLVISSTDNLILESDFTNQGYSWELNSTNRVIEPSAGRGGGPALRFKSSTAVLTSLNLMNKIPVGQDDRFRASIFYKTNANLTAGRVSIRLKCYTTATAFTEIIIVQNAAETTSGTWKQLQGISPSLPTGTIAVEFMLRVQNPATTTVTDIDFVSVTRAFTGALIVDGAIDGQIITGATVRTAATGARIQIDSAGLQAFDANNDRYLNVVNGRLEMIGSLAARGTTNWGATIDAIIGSRTAFVGGSGGTTVSTVTSPGLGFIRVPAAPPTSGGVMPSMIIAEPAGIWSYDGEVVLVNSGQLTIPTGTHAGLKSPRLLLDPTGTTEGGYAEINAPAGLKVKAGPYAFANVSARSLTEVLTVNDCLPVPVMGHFQIEQTGVPINTKWGPGMPGKVGEFVPYPTGSTSTLLGSWTSNDYFTVSATGLYTVNWHISFMTNTPSSGWMEIGYNGTGRDVNFASRTINSTTNSMAMAPVLFFAGERMSFAFAQNAGSNQTIQHKLRITRIG